MPIFWELYAVQNRFCTSTPDRLIMGSKLGSQGSQAASSQQQQQGGQSGSGSESGAFEGLSAGYRYRPVS